ncbi:SDR family NAD(P)-dependent oxidoreductase [Williamsia serinedens]|uniref:NAD(P)-dependent dehydrogenase, short-chain alcohol dehydrogenase family n=1 Tax=Williamsia serinedens TaxID=391736 RepID=A0ABT1GYC7_9NOCA|nr:SDR family NAD(P)-dependent oxidoreductase [Williamsia serinedens]MCP2159994.1 NAD(P)-dependent dehydrogenase, short-chain alcohol dehydrogenase family [Williamsia serinedens]
MPDSRITLVTGANRGIGRALTAQLADRGHTVLLAARDPDAAKAAAADLSGGSPERAILPLTLDVTDPGSVTAAAELVRSEHGHLDVLVNNAAIHFDPWQTAVDADLTVVDEAIRTNLLGTWRVTQSFLPLLRGGHDPRIVIVSSEQASLARMGGGVPAYKTSKAAVNALGRMLAAELADDGITVDLASPGWTATDMGGDGGRPVDDGAASVRQVVELETGTGAGRFLQDGIELPW